MPGAAVSAHTAVHNGAGRALQIHIKNDAVREVLFQKGQALVATAGGAYPIFMLQERL